MMSQVESCTSQRSHSFEDHEIDWQIVDLSQQLRTRPVRKVTRRQSNVCPKSAAPWRVQNCDICVSDMALAVVDDGDRIDPEGWRHGTCASSDLTGVTRVLVVVRRVGRRAQWHREVEEE